MGYGEDDAQAVESYIAQTAQIQHRGRKSMPLQSFLDHADPEEEIAADVGTLH
ncbi:MAG: hypothetical protein ACLTLQ_10810 [[Clostridium] scindens]